MTEPVRFTDWPLRAELLAGLAEQGLVTPTPVQEAAFPKVLEGRDLLVQSRTGTGKTLAFGLPLLQRLPAERGAIAALIVLPTRELAMQVATALGRLARPLGHEVAALYGGGSYRDQLRSLHHGARIVVGTPGRLVDHLEKGHLKLAECTTIVLDEADEMLDLGFAEELDALLGALPAERQSLLFSATLAPGTAALAAKTLRDPLTLALSGGSKAAPEIQHVAYECFAEHKTQALVNVIHHDTPDLAIVFCHTKAETEGIMERLREEGFAAGFLNGDLPQAERTRTLNAFRRGQIGILVATDVAARGLDVKGVTHVYNLGVPRDPESYVHRVGRTGRAGAAGIAATFVPPRDAGRFRRMLFSAGVKIETRPVPQAADVRKRLREVYHETIGKRVERGVSADFQALATELLGWVEPADLVAALLQGDEAAQAILVAGADVFVPRPMNERPKREPRPAGMGSAQGLRQAVEGGAAAPGFGPDASAPGEDGGKPRRERPQRKLSEHQEPGMARVWVNTGKAHSLMPGHLVKMICQSTGLTGEAIGAIAIHPYFAFFDVKEAEAARVVERLNTMNQHGRPIKANLVN